MKFLIDMNLSPRWCEVLQRHNFIAQHWSNIGSANAPDQLLLEYARDNQFVVLTSDLDFGYLLALGRYQAPSVVLLRVLDDRPEVLEIRLLTVLSAHQVDLEQGALLVLDEIQARVRILPLGKIT
jgi:predicted nuclease of predicted toxin-antitoxin system